MAGTDGPGGQFILAPMVRGTIYSRCGWSGGPIMGDHQWHDTTISNGGLASVRAKKQIVARLILFA